MRLRNDVRGHHLANSLPGRRPGVDRDTDSSDIASHNRGDQAGIDLLPTNETNVCSFHHGVSRFDHRYQSTTFNHSECFWHNIVLCALCFVLCALCFVLVSTGTNKVPSTKHSAQRTSPGANESGLVCGHRDE